MPIDRNEVAKKLEEKGAILPCHRCGQKTFTILEGFTNLNLQEDFSAGLVLGGTTVPVIHVVCNNCGALSSHALGALNMLPNEKEDSNAK